MIELTAHYNDNPQNTRLTHRRLRCLICELYKLEENWDDLPAKTKRDVWRALNAKVFRLLLDEMPSP